MGISNKELALILKEADVKLELTSKLTEPFLFVSKASNRKCAYILESAMVENLSNPPVPEMGSLWSTGVSSDLNID